MKTTLENIKKFLGYWAEITWGIPAAFLVLVGTALLYAFLFQGRQPIDPPTDLMAYAQRFFGLILAAIFTGLGQYILFGYRSTKENPGTLWDDTYDAAVTIALLTLSAILLLR